MSCGRKGCTSRYPCQSCYEKIQRAINGDTSSGGTATATNFKSKANRDDPSIVNHFFNTPGDGASHGHVQEKTNDDGSKSYPFVRDVEGRTTK